jgi:hypothetical protein
MQQGLYGTYRQDVSRSTCWTDTRIEIGRGQRATHGVAGWTKLET